MYDEMKREKRMKSAEERKESRGVSTEEIDIIDLKYARQIHHPLYSACRANLHQRRGMWQERGV